VQRDVEKGDGNNVRGLVLRIERVRQGQREFSIAAQFELISKRYFCLFHDIERFHGFFPIANVSIPKQHT